jgi:uncharacterized protein DUF3124
MSAIKLALSLLVFGSSLAFGQNPVRTKGQLLYLPIYSHIWHGEITRDGQPVKTLLSVSVSIRNMDPSNAITITSAQYFSTGGTKLKEYVSAPSTIAPMATYELFVPRSDDTGGSGANFVIVWKADRAANAPVVEAIHADLPGSRSIIFTTAARQIVAD